MYKFIAIAFLLIIFSCRNHSGTSSNFISNENSNSNMALFYIGTYTNEESKGIYKSTLDLNTGKFTDPELAATIENPSFQCISNNNSILWSVSELWNGTGKISSYSIDYETGDLSPLSSFSSLGDAPCYIDFHEKNRNILVANYNSGDIITVHTNINGTPEGKSHIAKHHGRGPNISRQDKPHAHCAIADPQEKFIYSCDLGTDEIYVYTIQNDSLIFHKTIKSDAGAGPRHIAFHPKMKTMEVINELNGSIVTFLPDSEGCFSIYHHRVSTLPENYNGDNKSADIHFSPDGKFLYASNRGPDNIAIYKFDDINLIPVIIGWQSEEIKTPRNFAIDPSGKYLLVANQDGNSIVVFKIESLTGNLISIGNKITVSQPVCLTFLDSNN